MVFRKKVENPMLAGTIEMLKADDTPEHRVMMMEEIFQAEFMTPVRATPSPTLNEDGTYRLEPGSKLQFPLINGKDGKQFFVACTNEGELKKCFKDDEDPHYFTVSFKELSEMQVRKDANGNMSPAVGIVINPLSSNIIVPKEASIKYLLTLREQQLRTNPPKQGN